MSPGKRYGPHGQTFTIKLPSHDISRNGLQVSKRFFEKMNAELNHPLCLSQFHTENEYTRALQFHLFLFFRRWQKTNTEFIAFILHSDTLAARFAICQKVYSQNKIAIETINKKYDGHGGGGGRTDGREGRDSRKGCRRGGQVKSNQLLIAFIIRITTTNNLFRQ